MKIYLSENIIKYRKQLGLSQRELSKISGVPLSMITKIEQGVSKEPTIWTVAKIAKVLNLRIDSLIYTHRKKKYTSKDGYTCPELVKYALCHIDASERLFKLNQPYSFDSAGYLAHLGIELLFKAFLLYKIKEFPPEHNLELLYGKSIKHEKFTLNDEGMEILRKINCYYDLRYMDPRNIVEIGSGDIENIKRMMYSLLKLFPDNILNEVYQSKNGVHTKGGRILMVKSVKNNSQ